MIIILLSTDFALYLTKNILMDISKSNRLATKNMLVEVTSISGSIDFVLHPEAYIIFGIIMYLEKEAKTERL